MATENVDFQPLPIHRHRIQLYHTVRELLPKSSESRAPGIQPQDFGVFWDPVGFHLYSFLIDSFDDSSDFRGPGLSRLVI